MRFFWFFTPAFLLCAAVTLADELKGRVTDADGNGLPAVSVVTNLPPVGTMTDENGYFTLEARAPAGDETVTRVTFSSVGYHSRQFAADAMPEIVVLEERYYRGTDILVRGDRAQPGITPVAFDNVSRDDIERDYMVGEFPLLMETTPNVYAYTESGTSLGDVYYKIRGFDGKRIATYINGVPLNDPEDHHTYFIDLPDFAGNISDIQIQRGVGNSLYGDASFGGAINVVTSAAGRERQTILTAGYGEYTSDGKSVSDIYRQSIEYSSGLIDGRWHFAGRFSKQKTGGYREYSWYRGWAYYLSMARLDHNMTTELHIYGGPIKNHLAYYGVGRQTLEENWRANPGIEDWEPFSYSNAIQEFNQPHYQLHNVLRVDDRMTLFNTLYYIRGKGYYEQLRMWQDYFDYGIDTSLTGGNTVGTIVRQKWVHKNQYGWNPRLEITHGRGRHVLGGSLYLFDSDHFGELIWVEHAAAGLYPHYRYYHHYGDKKVVSLYGQEQYDVSKKLSVQATAQVRYERYALDQERMGPFQGYNFDVNWLFFSPRFGLNYRVNDNTTLFANLAVSSRPPTDDDIYDADKAGEFPSLEHIDSVATFAGVIYRASGDPTAKPERVYDFELGGQYRTEKYAVAVNFFYMDFQNEILEYAGAIDGRDASINVDGSFHSGLELSGKAKLSRDLTVTGNMAYNYNRIKDYPFSYQYDVDSTTITGDTTWSDSVAVNFKDKVLPNFPEFLGNVIVDYERNWLRLTGRGRLIGRQYADLYNLEEYSIDPVFVASLAASVTVRDLLHIGDLRLSLRVDNLFDKKHEAVSSWAENWASREPGQSAIIDGWAAYFVAPERSFYGQIQLEMF